MLAKQMLSVSDLTKTFAAKHVLEEVFLTVGQNEIVALMGASGCGKTTLLRIIAGLERADEGEITIDGREARGIDPYDRGIACIFQGAEEILPGSTVYQNIGFGATKYAKLHADERVSIDETIRRCAALAKVPDWLLFEKGRTISGGERQRVSLARVLAERPKIVLADEPLSNLDMPLRERLVFTLREFFKSNNLSVLYVTHDPREAAAVADRVLQLGDGVITHRDSPMTNA